MLRIYHDSLDLIRGLEPLVRTLERKDKDLARQLRRAATSIPLNIAEGFRRNGKDRAHHYRIAAGSAAETGAALEVAHAWGHLPTLERQLDQLDKIRATLWKLCNR